mmetsp:Transcript_50185/g.58586  ORF Transcript_50185/g.58586 Transcript_50185/m.58586 type:complete len:417 (+) Transcript_50185:65-1315(+)
MLSPLTVYFGAFVFMVAQYHPVFPRISSSTKKEVQSSPNKVPTSTLRNDDIIPLVGLGCASGVRKSHVASALELGYRFIDTAQSYSWGYHEDEVGDAIFESNVDRGEIYLQTKIHPEDLGYEATRRAVETSLTRLKVTSIDSVLIHKPRCWEGACQKVPEGTWQDSWMALEEFYDAKLVKSIGICDVDDVLFNQLLEQRIKPHIIQNWMDPFHQDTNMRDRCKKENVQYQAYSTLGSQRVNHQGHEVNPVLNDNQIIDIARSHSVDAASVVINWATKRGVSVLPASTKKDRQKSNLEASYSFDLTEAEMKVLDSLDGTLVKHKSNAAKPEKKKPGTINVMFKNEGTSAITTYWVEQETGDEVSVGDTGNSESSSLNTYHGHVFIHRHAETGDMVGVHSIEEKDGKRQEIVVSDNEL